MDQDPARNKKRISNIEQGISNDEVLPLPVASAFDIPCSIFDISARDMTDSEIKRFKK
jgi:hypothetical protein